MDVRKKLEKYISDNLVVKFRQARVKYEESCECVSAFEDVERVNYDAKLGSSINTFIDENKDENKFQKLLFKYIDKRNLKDSDVYNKVNIDRRLFSKIRSDRDYHPSKETIILLGISLNLSLDELLDLLNSASYSLPNNDVFNLIIKFCFIEGIYDLDEINSYLYDYNCKTIGVNN